MLVDEYQDTNALQSQFLKLILSGHRNLCVVGDDDQSIYAWRGADSSHILNFSQNFPDSKLIVLDQNYRSTPEILSAAQFVIEQNSLRHPKILRPTRPQGSRVTEIIAENDIDEAHLVVSRLRDLCFERIEGQRVAIRKYSDFAILFRASSQTRLFEDALRREEIPYRVVGALSYLERKEIKDTLAAIRALINPEHDLSLKRILGFSALKISRTSLLRAWDQNAQTPDISFEEALKSGKWNDITRAKLEKLLNLRTQIREELAQSAPSPAQTVHRVLDWLEALELRASIHKDKSDPAKASRLWNNVEEFVHGLGMTQPDRAQEPPSALDDLAERVQHFMIEAKDQEDDESKDADKVTLMTLHASKGLEFFTVFLVGLEEGFLPHRNILEAAQPVDEERRLCYVGITRARRELFLSRCRTRIRYGKAVLRTPSRFRLDIPNELLQIEDHSKEPEHRTAEAKELHEQRVASFFAEMKTKLSD